MRVCAIGKVGLSFSLTLAISKSGVSVVTETISVSRWEAISVVGVCNRGGVSSTVRSQVLGISLRLSISLTLTISESGVSVVRESISICRWEAISVVGVCNRGGVSSTVSSQVLGISLSLWFSLSLTLAINSMRVGVGISISICTRHTISIGGWVSSSVPTIPSIYCPWLGVSHDGSSQACKKCKLHH